MNGFKLTSAVAASVAMFATSAAQAQVRYVVPAQGYGYPSQVMPAASYGYPQAPCTTGQCGVPSYQTNYQGGYQQTPCATGNCPTPNGACQTICGPNGCTTVCPTGVNQSLPSYNYGSNVNVGSGTVNRTLPSLNLDQVQPGWNNGPSFGQPMNFGQQGGFSQPINNVPFGQPQPGFFPASVNGASNDGSVRLY